VPVFEGAFLLRLAPEDLVVAVGVERRVDVDEIDARRGESPQLVEIVPAVDDPRIDQCRGLTGCLGFP
jgi:hypothetical protein